MASNHLESLIAEWYEYSGYFVRRNVLVGKRAGGGYECELDIVAFHPKERRLVHLEPSLDAHSWDKRELRFLKKFEAGRKYIPSLFEGIDIPATIEQYAILAYATNASKTTLGGGTIRFAGDVVADILSHLKDKRLAKAAVPEQFPLVRTLQYVTEFRNSSKTALGF